MSTALPSSSDDNFFTVISSLIENFGSYSRVRGSINDDWVDRLNHLYTVVLLVIFAVIISTGQYVGDAIQCWCPAEFTDAFVDYTKSYCWIANTYYIPMTDVIPVEIRKREDKQITYYQWVPLILLFQAFMFKFPNILWTSTHELSGLNLDKIVSMAEDTQLGSPDDREETIKNIAHFLTRWLEAYREYKLNFLVKLRQRSSRMCCFLCSRRQGTFLTGLYVFVKMLYVANVIGQFFLLNAFMATDYTVYGVEVLKSLVSNTVWQESPRFPRVTLCDLQIRQLQNLQRYTVQCVLPINLFNEKIFIFLWFWFVFVAACSCINLLSWFYRFIFSQAHIDYVTKYIRWWDTIQTKQDRKLCQKFTKEYLRDDGFLVLRVIAKNSTDLVAGDLLHYLWKAYKEKNEVKNKEPAEVGSNVHS
ncbi:innexin unc-9 isoform X1 [Argonauta hians]